MSDVPRMTKERWAELEEKERHKLSSADWKEIKTEMVRARITEEFYLEELNQYADVIGLNPIQYPKGRRLPDPELHQDPAFFAMKLGELEDQIKHWEDKEIHEAMDCYVDNKELDALRLWKEQVENLMGQRGVENIAAMLDIINAAIRWEAEREGGTSIGSRGLTEAVEAYDDMVANREDGEVKDE